jgi:hypothetical protein
LLGSLMDRQRDKLGAEMLRKGWISRAEYEESKRVNKPGAELLPR